MDLNLLKVFYALSTERHVTKAADTVGLSQPAVSHALSRLRAIFGDELFVRTRDGMKPTARCQSLFEPVRQALNNLDVAFGEEQAFDPATAKLTLRIGMNDLLSMTLLPTLMERVTTQAPGIDIRVIHTLSVANVPRLPTDPIMDLDSGRTDLALIQHIRLGERFTSEKVFSVDHVCVTRFENENFHPPIDAETYKAHGHIMVTWGDIDTSRLSDALEARGLRRNIKTVVPLYSGALAVAAQTDLVHTMPRLLLPFAEKHYRLKISELPRPSPISEYYQVWHKTRTSDPAHAWLRQTVRDCFEDVQAEMEQAT